jgi:CheY-like chemotaxis protein
LNDEGFAGQRVLLVEDDALIAMNMTDMLDALGCVMLGPAARVGEALAAVEAADGAIDAAVLDVNLAGQPSFPVADALAERQIPFVFATGYGSAGLRDDLRDRPVLLKPFKLRELKQALAGVLVPA